MMMKLEDLRELVEQFTAKAVLHGRGGIPTDEYDTYMDAADALADAADLLEQEQR